MAEGSVARIDRAALERIIQRAAELQTAERDLGDSLTSDELIALGREVGIPGRYLQQALLEERTRLVNVGAAGLFERVTGPGQISAQRVVRGDPDAVEAALLQWMERNELLCVQRHQTGRITWEPLGGIQAAFRRSTAAIGGGKRPFMLSRAATVSATVVPLEPGYAHVSLMADTRKVRGEYVGVGAALAGAGMAGTAAMVALGALLPDRAAPAPRGSRRGLRRVTALWPGAREDPAGPGTGARLSGTGRRPPAAPAPRPELGRTRLAGG